MPTVECSATTCKYCERTSEKYGECGYPGRITMKFRAAIDFPGKGTVIYFECLQIDYEK